MGHHGACDECVLKCLVMHGRKHHSSSIVRSFFKVIVDDQFSELFVPPEFAPSLRSLVNKETLIEDVRARKWKVRLSYIKGRLAFGKGWRAFAVSHGIKIGDFIVFHYIEGDHFVAQIFAKTACERMNFPAETNVLSTKRIIKSTVNHKDDNHHGKGQTGKDWLNGSAGVRENSDTTQDKMEVECIGAVETVSKQVDYCEHRQLATVGYVEPFIMMNWDAHSAEGDDGNRLLDLSELEFSNTRALDKIDSLIGGEGVVGYSHTTEKGAPRLAFTETSPSGALVMVSGNNVNAIEGKMESMNMLKDPSEEAAVHMLKRRNTYSASKGGQSNQLLNLNPRHTTTESNGSPPSSDGSGRIMKIETREGINMMPLVEMRCNNVATRNFDAQNSQICVVKPEPPDFSDLPVPYPFAVSCVVTQDSEYCLEMPASLPSARKSSSSSRSGKRVVFLRDPCGRVWPALYLEKHNVKVLARGWRSFKETNQIQTGDECVFAVENEAEDLYNVQIIHKPGHLTT